MKKHRTKHSDAFCGRLFYPMPFGTIKSLYLIVYLSFPEIGFPGWPFSRRPVSLKNYAKRFQENFAIQPQRPVFYVLRIQPYYFIKICDLTAPADLPHAGKPRFDRHPDPVVQIIKLPFIHRRRTCTYQTHFSLQNIKKLRKLIQGSPSYKMADSSGMASPAFLSAPDHTRITVHLPGPTASYRVLSVTIKLSYRAISGRSTINSSRCPPDDAAKQTFSF